MRKGFTLVELLVAVAVFLIAITALAGVFTSALRNQRYVLTSQQLLDQGSYALEYMSKSLRMAKKDEEGDCVASGKTYEYESGSLKFKSQREECQEFSLAEGKILDRRKTLEGKDVYNSEYLPLLSDKFEIQDFGVFVKESGSEQPRVTIFFDIVGKEIKDNPRIRLQTTVSQRDLNL